MRTFVVLILLLITTLPLPKKMEEPTISLPEVACKTIDREVFDVALEQGADTLTAKMIVAQARFESGNFENNLTLSHNNVFAMQHPRRRQTTSLGALATAEGRPRRYASYGSIRDSVIDLFLYFKAKNIQSRQPSLTIYVRTLKSKGFFEDSEKKYKNELKKILNQTNL